MSLLTKAAKMIVFSMTSVEVADYHRLVRRVGDSGLYWHRDMMNWSRQFGILLAFVLTLFGAHPANAQEAQKKKVLVFYPDKENSPGNLAFDLELRQLLHGARPDVEIFNEFLDTSRFPSEDYQQQLARFLRDKYDAYQMDVVVVGLAPSLDFVLKFRSTICPGVPVVFGAIEQNEVKTRSIPPDVIGIPMTFALEPTLQLALKLQPHIKKVYITAGTSPFDQHWLDQARQLFQPYTNHIEFHYISDLSVNELKGFVTTVTPDSIIYYLHMLRDKSGTRFSSAEVVSQLASLSCVAIYGHIGTYLGRGIVGGQLMEFEYEARNAGHLVLQLLDGKKPNEVTMPVPAPSHYTVDWRQLKRWGLSESDLPQGTVVKFIEPTFWDSYRWHIMGFAALCIIQAVLISSLLLQRLNRRKAEQRLSNSQGELIALTGRMMQAQESERRHIARELHDDLNQNLALLAVELDLLNRKPPESQGQLSESLTKLSSHVKDLSTFVHDLSHQLHPAKIEQLGLVTALRGLCRELGGSHNLIIDFSADDVHRPIPQAVGLCLYRIAQEALRNAIKHSKADGLEVKLRQTADELIMSIADNGAGFDLANHQEHTGLGLLSMRERLRLVDGSFQIESRPEEGTRIEVKVPLHQEACQQHQDVSTIVVENKEIG